MKANGFGQRQLSEDSGNNRKKQLARSNATCSDEPPRPATAGRPPPVFSPSEPQWYTDKTGVNLIQFIRNTLHKNPKDREMMLLFERDMKAFIQDTEKRALRFPRMSSYNRMLIHRAAAFFGLDHNIDNSASCVICTKTPKTRIPEIDFKSLIVDNCYTDHALRNQYPRRSAQSFDESYPRGSRRQYRNAQSNSLDLTRRGNSVEIENPPYFAQAPFMGETYGTPLTALPPGFPLINVTYQPVPYTGPPICSPYACKESPLQEHLNENSKNEDGIESHHRTTSSTTTTVNSEESEPLHYISPIYDPAHFTSLHAQAVTYHAMPGIPVGYIVVQDNNVKLVAQADVSNITAQFNALQLGNPPFSPVAQTPFNPASPPTFIPATNALPYGIEIPYSSPGGGNIAYMGQGAESPSVVYATPVGGIPYASPSNDPSLTMQQYPGYSNVPPMYLPMYTMVPNVVPAQHSQYPPSSSQQYDASMPGPSGSNTN